MSADTPKRSRWVTWLTRTLVAGLFLAVLVSGTALLHWRAGSSTADATIAVEPIPVTTLTLVPASAYDIVDRFVGRLEPAQTAALAFERGGLVVSVLVEEGQEVAKGEVVATLDTRLLEAERDRLRGQRQRLVAELELARLTEERQLSLEAQGHASTQRLDEARLSKAALEGELTALDAAIQRVAIDLDKSVLRAAFAGTVGAREIDPGSVVAAGTIVAHLLETGRPQARIGISPRAASSLGVGDMVQLWSDGHSLSGRLIALRPDLSAATRTTSALIALESSPDLRFGETIELRVQREVRADGFWLPLTALREGQRGLWSVLTLVEGDDGSSVIGHEAVEVLHVTGEQAFVRGTLSAGQQVLTEGHNRVVPGQLAAATSPVKDPS